MQKVLLVDDNVADLNGVADFTPWKQLGCENVATARNGRDGLEKALTHKPDLIVTDISMPIMDGIEMCREIRKSLPDVYIIFLSCLEEFEYAKSALHIGKCDYITKPISIDTLVQSVLRIKMIRNEEIKKEMRTLQLERQIRQNRPLLIENLFRNLFFGLFRNVSEIRRQAQALELSIDSQYSLILFETNDNPEASFLSVELLCNLLAQNPFDSEEIYTVRYKSTSVVALFRGGYQKEQFLEVINRICSELRETRHTDCTVCIGKPSVNFEEIADEFRRLDSVMTSQLFFEAGVIVFADEFYQQSPAQNQIDFARLYDNVAVALSSGSAEVLNGLVDKYLSAESEAQCKAIGYYILTQMNIILFEMNTSAEKIPQAKETSLWEKIMGCKSQSDMRILLLETLEQAQNALNADVASSADIIVNNITKIVKNDYANIQTLEEIADRIFLSLPWANRVFKKKTGYTIYEYLLQTRMDKAKELLTDPARKISEIGQMVGYTNNAYFSTAFKNYTGITPKQYRLKNQTE